MSICSTFLFSLLNFCNFFNNYTENSIPKDTFSTKIFVETQIPNSIYLKNINFAYSEDFIGIGAGITAGENFFGKIGLGLRDNNKPTNDLLYLPEGNISKKGEYSEKSHKIDKNYIGGIASYSGTIISNEELKSYTGDKNLGLEHSPIADINMTYQQIFDKKNPTKNFKKFLIDISELTPFLSNKNKTINISFPTIDANSEVQIYYNYFDGTQKIENDEKISYGYDQDGKQKYSEVNLNYEKIKNIKNIIFEIK